jgi:transcriptional regulator with XRE-family HTH domain
MSLNPDVLICFGARVRALRKAQGLSQESFATQCGLDRTYVGGIERGERNVGLRNIEILARTLGITISELMEGINCEHLNA